MVDVPNKIEDEDEDDKPSGSGFADVRIRAGNYGEIGDEQPLGEREEKPNILKLNLPNSADRAKDNSRLLGSDTDPDRFAEAKLLAEEVGANVDDVYEAPEHYKEKRRSLKFDSAVNAGTATAKFFQNADNYRAAHDSAEELSAVEAAMKYGGATIKYSGRAVARSGLRVAAGTQQFLSEESAEQADDADKSFMEILRQENPIQAASPLSIYNPLDLLLASERYVTSRLLSQKEAAKTAAYRLRRVHELNTRSQSEFEMAQAGHLKAIVEAGEIGPMEAIEAAVSDPGATMLLGLELAGEFALQLGVAAGVTAYAGPIAGSAAMGVLSGATERFASPAEYFAKQGYDLSKPEDIEKIVSNRELMLQAEQYGWDRAKIIGSLDAISGGVASQVYGGALRTMLVNMVAQPVLGGGGEALAQLKTEGKVENWGEVVLEAIGELAIAPPEVAVFGGKEINNVRKARKAKRQAARLKDALELSRKTKLAERAPEIAAEHRAEVFRDNDIDEVTINANTLNEYAQELDDPGFIESLGVTNEQMAEAIQLGGDIKIDADGFAVLTGAESYSEIADHVRFDDSGMTAAEAQEYEDSFFADQMERLEGQVAAIDLEAMSDVETIRKEVEAQVKAAGRSDNEAQFYGLLLAERYATRGERADMSPLEMWRRDNVRVTAPGQALPGFDMLDIAIDKLRGGVSAEQFLGLRKTPMINALVERGGVDPTGPLAAELAARDITPKTNRRLFVKGGLQSADDLVQSEIDILDAVEGTDSGYVSQDVLIEAIESDIGGAPFRSLDEQRQIEEYEGDIAELQMIMDQAGLTPEATNEEIRAAVDAAMQEAREFEQTDTSSEAFQRWFKDSKVVDENGQPLVVYHGTKAGPFESFNMATGEIARAMGGEGAQYFTENIEQAQFFADPDGQVIPVYLSMQNPMVIDQLDLERALEEYARNEMQNRPEDFVPGETLDDVIDGMDLMPRDFVADYVAGAKDGGFDGLIIRNFADLDQASDVFLPLEPTQIKSVDNRGTFDPNDERTFFQSTGLRAGTEDLSAYGIEPGGKYKVRDVAIALEKRQRDKYGTIDRDDRSEEASDRLSDWMADEVAFEYENNPAESGVGWYSKKFQDALDDLAEKFPEFKRGEFNPDNLSGLSLLENRQNARDFFTAILAITSDGQRVADNFNIAMEIYAEFRQTGQLPVTDPKGARRVASVVTNLKNMQALLAADGPKGMHDNLLRELTVKEMNAELRAAGKSVIGGYTADMIMPYSALIFGSKLGAFYANLMGATGYLTMDLWWTRSFNRYRGNMLPDISGLNNQLDKHGDPMGLARFKRLYAIDKRLNTPWEEITDDEALTYLHEYQAAAKAKGFKNTTEIEKAANTLHKAAFTTIQEQPYNASDRKFMVDAVQKAQNKLEERGITASIADIQAILWYYEKRLYGELTGAKPSDISYAEAVKTIIRDPGRGDRQGVEPTLIEGPDGTVFETYAPEGLESAFSDASYLAKHFQQRAYHGTPHRFEKFSTGAIGTGEGVQAYGWGLYFASQWEVANFYRETLSGSADASQFGFEYDGVVLTPSELVEELWGQFQMEEVYDTQAFGKLKQEIIDSGMMVDDDVRPQDLIDRDIEVPLLKDNYSGFVGFQYFINQWANRGRRDERNVAFAKEQGLDFYQGFLEAEKLVDLFDIKVSKPGRLFEVDIPEDNQFLNFSDPVTKQSDLVIQAMKNIQEKVNYNPNEDPSLVVTNLSPQTGASKSAGLDVLSGEHWYRAMAEVMGLDVRDRMAGQSVSLALAQEGVAGNRFLDHSQKSYNYVVYDDKLINVVQYEQRERASIEFRAHETVIKLGKDADPSSFLHENGHLFLEQMKADALEFGTEQLVTDWNTVRDWWGKNTDTIRREATRYARNKEDQDAVAALEKMSDGAIRAYVRSGDLTGGKEYVGKGGTPESALGYLTEAMHEQFARGFEDYLRTGEAPSVQLQSAFNRFRAWLVSIYSSIKRRLGRDVLDVQYSEEVRQVIDRLLASDQDIELVREQYDLKALYDSAEEAGMTPKQFATYQRQVARAVERSKTHQLKKHLNEVEREKRTWWKAEGDKIAGQIREELAQEPVYKALWSLTQQALADGTPLPDEITIGRLDRKALISILQNKESMQRLPKVKGKVVYTTSKKESGVHPDVAAQMFGFADAMEMLLAMGQAQPFEAVVQERVEAQLKATHGDMLTDGSAVEEAIESVHIDETAEVLTAELNALRESKDKMKPAFIRQWAIEKLGGRKVGELRPNEFLHAERRHGKEAGKLLRKGDRLGAQRAKFKQLMNFYMAKEAIKARNEIATGRRYFSRFTAKRKDYKTLAADYVDQIKQILANYQFGPRLSDKKRASLMEFAEQKAQEDGVVLTIPPEIAAADGTTNYQDLTLDEFRTLKDTIKALETQGRQAKNIIIEGENVAIADAERQILERLEKRKPRKRSLRAAIERTPLLRDKLVGALAGLDASLSKVEFLAEMIDGEKVGPFKRFFFQPFADAEAARNDMVAQVGKPIMDAIDGLSKNSRKQLGKKVFIEGMNQNFTRSNLIMIALNTGNESNYDKMLRGSRKDITGAQSWTEESIDEALNNLTLEEWQLVQTIWDAFEKMYPQVEEVFRQENGRSPERIDARGFERTFDGQTYTFRGGYFPMMYDGKRSIDGTLIESKTALEAMQSQHVQASVFSGMTKERSAGFAIPVDLDITQIPGHLNSTAHYITHYEPIRSVKKLMRQDDLVRELNLKMGKEYIDTFDSWLGAVASNQALDAHQGWWQKFVSIMRTNATVAIMGLSYTTMTAQLLGYFQTVDALAMTDGKYNLLKGKKWLAVGMTEYMRNPRKAVETVNALSGEMRHRINNTERDVSYGLRQLERKMTGKTKYGYKDMQRYSLMAIAGIQTFMVDYPTWLGAYNKALSEGRNTEDAAKYADAVLRTTQTAGGIKDLSQVQRSSIMLPLTMFYSFFNVLYNIEKQIVGNVETIKDVPQAAARALVVMILPTAIEQMYKDQWPDEEEESDDLNQDGMIDNKEYAWWVAKKAMIYAGSSVPLFRDMVGIASGYGYSATPMDSLGKGLDKSFRDLSKAIDDGEITNARLRAMITVVGFSAGLPIMQLNRVVRTAYKMEEGEEVDWYDWIRGYRKPSTTPFKD